MRGIAQHISETVIKFAEQHLEPFSIRNNELIADLCPFCAGGDNLDKGTFYLSLENGLYQCKRGSCARKGRLEDLAKNFGEQVSVERGMTFAKPKKNYERPDLDLLPVTDEIIEYFDQRKISLDTLDAFEIQSDLNGTIVFPFYLDSDLVYVKFRKPKKPGPKDRKEWMAPNTMPILFGMDMCSFSKP